MESSEIAGEVVVVGTTRLCSSDQNNYGANNDISSKTFGDLPTEIRLLIWSFCIPGGRMIKGIALTLVGVAGTKTSSWEKFLGASGS